jgi:hypothetical protein
MRVRHATNQQFDGRDPDYDCTLDILQPTVRALATLSTTAKYKPSTITTTHLTLINTDMVDHVDADDVDQCDDCGTDPDDGDDDRAGACDGHGHGHQVVVIHVFYRVSSPLELGVNPRMIGVSIAPQPSLLNYCCVSNCAMKV